MKLTSNLTGCETWEVSAGLGMHQKIEFFSSRRKEVNDKQVNLALSISVLAFGISYLLRCPFILNSRIHGRHKLGEQEDILPGI